MKTRSLLACERARLRGTVSAALAVAVLGLGCMTPVPPPAPDNIKRARAARDVGVDHLSKAKLAMALRQLMLAESLNDQDVETQLWLAEAYRRKGRLSQSEHHLRRALDLEPDHHASMLNLAGLYIQLERYAETIELSNRLADDPLFSHPWTALTNRGFAQYKLGQLTEARGSYLEALDFLPRYWPAHLNLGIVERELGHHRQAIQWFEQALDQELGGSPEAEVNYRLGEVYVSLGNRDKAIVHFDAAYAGAPYESWGKQSKSYLELLR